MGDEEESKEIMEGDEGWGIVVESGGDVVEDKRRG